MPRLREFLDQRTSPEILEAAQESIENETREIHIQHEVEELLCWGRIGPHRHVNLHKLNFSEVVNLTAKTLDLDRETARNYIEDFLDKLLVPTVLDRRTQL